MKTTACVVLTMLFALWSGGSDLYGSENLDAEFGDGGKVITDFGIADDQARAIAAQADGKIVVAGFSGNSTVRDIAVMRMLPTGELDPDFNQGGTLTFNIADGNAVVEAMSVLPDGRILVAGTFDGGDAADGTRGFLARLNGDGSLDSSFGQQGSFVLSLAGYATTINDLQVADDARYIVAGVATGESGERAMVAAVGGDGRLDATFGQAGSVLLAFEYPTAAKAIALLPEGGMLLGGYSIKDGLKSLSLYRLRGDGALEETFGENGEVRIDVDGNETDLNDMAYREDGTTTFVGSCHNGSYTEILLGRVLADGGLDSGFGQAGVVRNDLGAESAGYSLAVDASGSILVAGSVAEGSGRDVVLLRYGVQGTGQEQETLASAARMDRFVPLFWKLSDFAGQAVVGTAVAAEEPPVAGSLEDAMTASFISEPVSVYDDESYSLIQLADGRVLLAGYADNGSDSDFLVLQFSPAALQSLAVASQVGDSDSNDNFQISTTPVSAVTRNSAMSGGTIRERTYKSGCEDDCSDSCQGSADPASCSESCLSQCPEALTVTARGVCYGTALHPVYRSAADDAGDGDSSGTATEDTSGSADDSSILPDIAGKGAYNYQTVHTGQTSDGTGTGSFGSHILNITPNTRYYVRAYAVLSDDTVIYGNEFTFETEDACFIATAAYGSLLDPHVRTLRRFRDEFLQSSELGRGTIGLYYRLSPGLAQFIDDRPYVKPLVRASLLPAVVACSLVLRFGAGGVLCAAILLSLSAAGIHQVLHQRRRGRK